MTRIPQIKKMLSLVGAAGIVLFFAFAGPTRVNVEAQDQQDTPTGSVGCNRPNNNFCGLIFPSGVCENSKSVFEDDGHYLWDASMGGYVDWDDRTNWNFTYDSGNGSGPMWSDARGPVACGDVASGFNIVTYQTFPSFSTNLNREGAIFNMSNLQMRTTEVNAQHGSVEYKYTIVTCGPDRYTGLGGCIPVAGSITADPNSCSQTISWNVSATAPSYEAYLWDHYGNYHYGSSGSFPVSLAPSDFTYDFNLYAIDGHGASVLVDTVEVTCAEQAAASLDAKWDESGGASLNKQVSPGESLNESFNFSNDGPSGSIVNVTGCSKQTSGNLSIGDVTGLNCSAGPLTAP